MRGAPAGPWAASAAGRRQGGGDGRCVLALRKAPQPEYYSVAPTTYVRLRCTLRRRGHCAHPCATQVWRLAVCAGCWLSRLCFCMASETSTNTAESVCAEECEDQASGNGLSASPLRRCIANARYPRTRWHARPVAKYDLVRTRRSTPVVALQAPFIM